ncbi:LysM peptidoglycan-binding domain-containing protein [Lysinibacillus telephonicus]|uniref:LysM peptidoglycan-binding domain-containing protein n=1 Tax=Lysinibacillus telephonicus TaxID=1714840 RepID=A0A431UNP9_9BACI|nr:LysM domain-containing protein [Lysinibacillus telephonicus]RTQ91611.1 LysM peptidoglycan-binding domain-containing protein [Lysinibacillus telephonicus]
MYRFFLDGMQLPIAPSSMTMKINGKNETVTLINEGEVNVLKKPGLTDIDFEVEFPNVKYPYAVYPNGFQPSAYYLDKLEKLKLSQKPFKFIVNRMKPNGFLLFDTNMTVSIEDYEIEDNAENGFDMVVKIKLKQYREYRTETIKNQPRTSSSTNLNQKVTVEKKRSTTGKEKPKTHTVARGETLWGIAKRYLGEGSKYTELAKINNLSNPNLIRVGQVIKLG